MLERWMENPVFAVAASTILCSSILLAVVGLSRLLSRFARGKQHIICPNLNCGFEGDPKLESRGNLFLGFFLLFLGLLPGLIYILAKSGKRWVCPRCGVVIRP